MAEPTLRPRSELDGAVLDGVDLTGENGTDSLLLECTLTRCDLSDVRLAGARFTECRVSWVHGAGTDLSRSQWLDSRIVQPRLGAPQLHGASMRRVRVEGGKVEFANWRGATLRDVAFDGCVLVEPDFAEASLRDVTFDGCRLIEPRFDNVRCQGVDLSGAELVAPTGVASLRGATLSLEQVLDVAPALARQLGIDVTG